MLLYFVFHLSPICAHFAIFYKHPFSVSVIHKSLNMTRHHTELWPKLPWQQRLGCPLLSNTVSSKWQKTVTLHAWLWPEDRYRAREAFTPHHALKWRSWPVFPFLFSLLKAGNMSFYFNGFFEVLSWQASKKSQFDNGRVPNSFNMERNNINTFYFIFKPTICRQRLLSLVQKCLFVKRLY